MKRPLEPVNTASLSNLELHVTKIYMISQAAEQIPMQVKDAERPPPVSDEEGQVDESGAPTVNTKDKTRQQSN